MTTLEKIRSELPSTCRILAVSKLQPVEAIRVLHQQGQVDFGENYVQEARAKQDELASLSIRWHMIGGLQRKKSKDVVGRFDLIHSVDTIDLARELDRKSGESGITQKILLQLNLALEETKGGFSEAELDQHWDDLKSLPHLQIHGLMTMPPLFENPEKARPFFRRLREWRDELRAECATCSELSMGTSSDYRVAADEGATWVRLGTILFGARPTR